MLTPEEWAFIVHTARQAREHLVLQPLAAAFLRKVADDALHDVVAKAD